MLTRRTLALLIAVAAVLHSAEPSAEEYHVKGAFLLNFAKFVDWPPESFKGPGDPLMICVLGENPFGAGFDKAAQGIAIGNRPVGFKQLADPQQAGQCHIVFVASGERKLSKILLQTAQSASLLTVGESDGFTTNGGIVGFKLDGEKVRIEINTAAADRAKLHISAKLLSLAQAGKRQ